MQKSHNNILSNIVSYTQICVCVLLISSCSNISHELKIERLEHEVFNNDSLWVNHENLQILSITFPNSGIKSDTYKNWSGNIQCSPIFESFYDKVDSVFPDNDFLGSELMQIYNNCHLLLPDYSFDIKTIITPFNQSVMLGEGYLAIGINHYLGSDEPLYEYFSEYKRKYKDKSRIKFDIAEAIVRNNIADSCNFDNEQLLKLIQLEGLVAKSMQLLIPDASIYDILMWNKDDIKWAEKYEFNVWQKLISNDLLYSTNRLYINEMIDVSPTNFLGAEIPDMFGRYIGYKIIDSYLKRENKGLNVSVFNEIVNELPQNILIDSGYNGR